MTWYLAGPITGREDWENRFDQAAKKLRDAGLQIVSPLDLAKRGESWGFNMRRCIRSLTECDGLILLDGWEESKGARLEREIAEGLGMTVVRFANLFPDAGENKEIRESSSVS